MRSLRYAYYDRPIPINAPWRSRRGKEVSCKQVGGTFPNANGINLWEDKLFVGDSSNGTVTVFQIQEDKTLTKLRVVVSIDLHTRA